ncbi:MAG: hypothetical protein IPG29_13510 [Sphingobacteriales bacterium]|nr:hypothetical protein [Sphingobacteriales bacterium]
MPDLKISQLPPVGTLELNAQFAIEQDGTTFRTYLSEVLNGVNDNEATEVLVDGVTIQGNGVSTPLSVIRPVPGGGILGDVLTVSTGGALIWTAPTGTGDNWGTQVVAHDATLTGDGTTSNTLKVANPLPAIGTEGQVLTVVSGNPTWQTATGDNWGTQVVAHDATLTGDGTTGNTLKVANPLPAVGTEGQVLTVVSGNPTWQTATGDNWGTQVVEHDTSLIGDGTIADPLGISTVGAATGEYLQFDGTNLVWSIPDSEGSGDNWGTQVVAHDATLTGDGTTGNTLKVANPLPAVGTEGQILTIVSGNPTWQTATGDNWGTQVVAHDATLTGDCTTGNTLKVANPLPAMGTEGQVLTVVSGNPTWQTATGDNWGTQVVAHDATLTGDGTTGNTLKVANPLPAVGTEGQVLTVVSGNPIWQTPSGGSYTAGIGIEIVGTEIKHKTNPGGHSGDVLQAANTMDLIVTGLQQVGISSTAPTNGQVLTYNGTQWAAATPSGGTYTAGLGIDITGTTIAHKDGANGHTGDVSQTASSMALTVTGLRNIAVSSTAPTNGQVLTYNGTQWAAATPSSLPTGTIHQTLRHDGTNWVADSYLKNAANTSGLPGLQVGTLYSDVVPTLLLHDNNRNIQSFAIYNNSTPASITNTLYFGDLQVANAGYTNQGLYLVVKNTSNTTNSHVKGIEVDVTAANTNSTAHGVWIKSRNTANSSNNFALRLDDGNAAVNKVWTCLNTNGDGQWQTPSGGTYTAGLGIDITGTTIAHKDGANGHTGDVSQTTSSMALTVTGLRNIAISTTTPTNGQVLTYNGTQWAPATPSSLPSGTTNQTLRHNETNWVANSLLRVTSAKIEMGDTGSDAATLFVNNSAETYSAIVHQNKTLTALGTVYGVYATAKGSDTTFTTNCAGYFKAENGRYNYSLRLEDGLQAQYKILMCGDSSGFAKWQTPATAIKGGDAGAVTGSRGGNAALANLLTKLALYGLIIDNTTT